MENLILAQYTVRAKQAYIFETSRLLENVGASAIIAGTFDDLCREAASAGVRIHRADGAAFSMEAVRAAMRRGDYEAAELFIGGGNDTILFGSREAFLAANRAYTRFVLEAYPGLWPLCVGVEIDPDRDDYREDYRRLMKRSEQVKNRMTDGRVRNALPFSMPDRVTYQPYSVHQKTGDREARLSAAGYAKREIGLRDEKTAENVRMLDDLVFERGTESLLAIVHADGNNMGIKIQRKLGDAVGYDHCVTVMRAFSAEIDRVFHGAAKAAVEQRLSELKAAAPAQKRGMYRIRWIVTDGDDMTFICNARLARALTEACLRAVLDYTGADGETYSACAGICVFNSHYPFARAYDLAEQACDAAKKPVHDTAVGRERPEEQCWMDFHYIHSGINGDLDEIRALQQTEGCMMRPWRVCAEGETDERDLKKLDRLCASLQSAGVSRTAIKTFGADYETDRARGELDWKRLCYNTKGLDERGLPWEGEPLLRSLYDLAEFYDLWFAREGRKQP